MGSLAMMGLKDKEFSSEELSENKKCCTDCKTTKTPLWRGGPAGPKTLCNACGIRYRKKRVCTGGSNKGQERKREKSQARGGAAAANSAAGPTYTTTITTNSTKSVGVGGSDLSESLKMKLMALGEEVLLQRPSSVAKKQRCQRRRKLGEEEQAAFCLMALSSGFVFA